MEELSEELKDKLTKVCLCKVITRATIKKTIQNGAHTLKEVQKAAGAGSGPCGGKRWGPKIIELLEEALPKVR